MAGRRADTRCALAIKDPVSVFHTLDGVPTIYEQIQETGYFFEADLGGDVTVDLRHSRRHSRRSTARRRFDSKEVDPRQRQSDGSIRQER